MESSSTEREELMKMLDQFNTCNQEEAKDKKRVREEKRKLKERNAAARIARDEQASKLIEYQHHQAIEADKNRDLEFITKSHDHLSGPLLQAVLSRKQEIAARWGWSGF